MLGYKNRLDFSARWFFVRFIFIFVYVLFCKGTEIKNTCFIISLNEMCINTVSCSARNTLRTQHRLPERHRFRWFTVCIRNRRLDSNVIIVRLFLPANVCIAKECFDTRKRKKRAGAMCDRRKFTSTRIFVHGIHDSPHMRRLYVTVLIAWRRHDFTTTS